MKKILSLLGAFGLTATGATTAISCATQKETANFTFLDFKKAADYSKEELYQEKLDLEVAQEAMKLIIDELNKMVEDISKGNIDILNITTIFNKINTAINQNYRYILKVLSYQVILIQKGWIDLNKIGEEINVTYIEEAGKDFIIQSLKNTYLLFKQTIDNFNNLKIGDKVIEVNPNLEKIFTELGQVIEEL